MNNDKYNIIKEFVQSHNYDFSHDFTHIERVLGYALEIAETLDVDYSVLIPACLLHDVGRALEFRNKNQSHEIIGANIAYDFLIKNHYNKNNAKKVQEAILSHSFRGDFEALTIEGKILFDADKIDLTGFIGVSRMLMYAYKFEEPLYVLNHYSDIDFSTKRSFVSSYNNIIKDLSKKMYTDAGKRLIEKHQENANVFYDGLLSEIKTSINHQKLLYKFLLD